MKNKIRKLISVKQNGVGVVEVILILVILIGLVLIFRDQITDIVTSAFETITGDATEITG